MFWNQITFKTFILLSFIFPTLVSLVLSKLVLVQQICPWIKVLNPLKRESFHLAPCPVLFRHQRVVCYVTPHCSEVKTALWRWLARVSYNCSLLCCYGDGSHTVSSLLTLSCFTSKSTVNNWLGDLLRSPAWIHRLLLFKACDYLNLPLWPSSLFHYLYIFSMLFLSGFGLSKCFVQYLLLRQK